MTQEILPDEIRKERAKDFLAMGRLEDARELLSGLCRDDQRDVESWFMLSAVNGHLGHFEEVIAACRKALEIEPGYLPAMNNLASALAALGRHEEAAEAFAAVLELAPDNPNVLGNYGHALALAGRTDEARAALEKAVQVQPFYVEAHYNLAILLDQLGMSAEALREYEQTAALKQGLPGVDDRMAKLRQMVGRRA